MHHRDNARPHPWIAVVAIWLLALPAAVHGQDTENEGAHCDTLATEAHKDSGPLSLAGLIHWREALENRRDWLAAREIPLLVVATPNKGTIYPERLPEGLGLPATSQLDQLLAHGVLS